MSKRPNLVKTIIERFGPRELKRNEMSFKYGNTVYPIRQITDRNIGYYERNWGAARGSLAEASGYFIKDIHLQRTIVGVKIIFVMG